MYHSSFIGRAGPKHKGRISRFLANKCSIAARIDCFSGELVHPRNSDLVSLTRSFVDKPSVKFGEALRDQVEERLRFFETGQPPTKNADVIRRVLEAVALEDEDEEGSGEEDDMNVDEDLPQKDAAGFPVLPLIEVSPPAEPSPKKKKGKKRKGDDMDVDSSEEVEEEVPRKKVKLSKEEKKALKKELKRKKKEEEKATGVCLFTFLLFL